MKEQRTMNAGRMPFGHALGNVQCVAGETVSERWKRFYRAPGGPLLGWLEDEAKKRGLDFAGLARELCVTQGYLAQLRSGIRETANIAHDFAAACAEFLGVPTVVVLVVAGHLKLVDFVSATNFDRWVESTVGHEEAQPVQLACGAQVGAEELRLLPLMVEAMHSAASVHETRARLR